MTSLNLLTDYGSDSEQSEIEDQRDDAQNEEVSSRQQESRANFFGIEDSSSDDASSSCPLNEEDSKNVGVLQNPFRQETLVGGNSSSEGPRISLSVFSNPFKDAEEAEKSTLEKHVKLAPKLEDIKEINGRKICWNYRKGRCRFGANCIFAHDSELLNPAKQHVAEFTHKPISSLESSINKEDKTCTGTTASKRPGLTQGMIPSKKVMKRHAQQVATEKPWTVKK